MLKHKERKTLSKKEVQKPKVHTGQYGKHNDNGCVDNGLLLGWPRNMLELAPGVTQIVEESVHGAKNYAIS